MGFEKGNRVWSQCVSDTQAYKQFGNSVVVPVVEAVAELMEPHIRSSLGDKVTPKPSQSDLCGGARLAAVG